MAHQDWDLYKQTNQEVKRLAQFVSLYYPRLMTFATKSPRRHLVTFKRIPNQQSTIHLRHCDPLTRRCGCDFGFLDVRGECVSETPMEDYIDRWDCYSQLTFCSVT